MRRAAVLAMLALLLTGCGAIDCLRNPVACKPDPVPTPTPTPTPPPEEPPPVIEPPPVEPPLVAFPVRFPLPGSRIYMRNKPAGHGQDSTPWVEGDLELCRAIHGTPEKACHFESPGVLGDLRAEYEMRVLAGARDGDEAAGPMMCPVWQYSPHAKPSLIRPCVDDHEDYVSCDHFGTQPNQDDPQTKSVFEGKPEQCGVQQDKHGPIAGFFTVPHGKGWIRACPPLDTAGPNCGPFRTFEH